MLKQLKNATEVFKEKDSLAKRLEENMNMLAAGKRERMTKWGRLASTVILRGYGCGYENVYGSFYV